MAKDLIAVIEQLTGRTVYAFLSDNHAAPDVAIESAPQDGAVPTASA